MIESNVFFIFSGGSANPLVALGLLKLSLHYTCTLYLMSLNEFRERDIV